MRNEKETKKVPAPSTRAERGRIMYESGCVHLPSAGDGTTAHGALRLLEKGRPARVSSWTRNDTVYEVILNSVVGCTCPDYVRAMGSADPAPPDRAHWCKHLHAVSLARAAAQAELRRQAEAQRPGRRLAWTRCSNCGKPTSAGSRWTRCSACGQTTSAPEFQAPPPPTEASNGIDWADWRTPAQIVDSRARAARRSTAVGMHESETPTTLSGARLAVWISGGDRRRDWTCTI